MKKNLFLIAIIIMTATPMSAQEDSNHQFEVAKNLEIFNTLYRHLDMLYVDTLDANKVIGGGINRMLQTLDPYTVYYPDANELQSYLAGKYAGIGALIRYNLVLNNAVIDEPYANTPAQEAGLKKGDIILSIDDSTMVGKSTSYVSSRLRGDAGTTFMLKIKRPSTGKVMQMKITRRQIQHTPTVPFYGLRPDSIGYLCLSQFTEDCTKEVRRNFIDMKNRGMKAFVLDLRDNGGGSESEAAQLVNMFVRKGVTVVENRGKMKRANHAYTTTVEPIDTLMPMVVLVNDNTASASEITSGALQDLDRAVILGTRTYGKGLVQLPVDLPYNAQLKVTTSKYYIPSGRCIQAINYSPRQNADEGKRGEVIPDSLTHVFHTLHGREVRDGGGITPDVVLQPDSIPNLVYYLSASGMDSTEVMHQYEVDYLARHPQIAKPSEFEISDQDYAEFRQRVLASGFKYDAESGKFMEQLRKVMVFEGYYDDAKVEFEALQKKLEHNLERDLDRHEATIRQLLSADIVAAHYYQAGSLEYNLKHDKQMREACRLLNTPSEYNALLRP